jgi:uncharacterized protein (DUF1501 family)
MLTIKGSGSRYCDGVTRRQALHIGGLAMGGLALPQLLQAEAGNGTRSQKSIIMIFLTGGPPHQDMVDLKMDAPVEIRGEFHPINTSVPGIDICELMPRTAKMMDKFAIIRSLVGSEGRHSAFQCVTGWPTPGQPVGGWPSLGAAVSKLQGTSAVGMPAFVGLSPKIKNAPWGDSGQAGYAGQAHAPFTPNADGGANLKLKGISLDTLGDRQTLMSQLDRLRREADADGSLAGLDAYHQQAFGILTSSKLADALDLEQEDTKLRDRYGRGDNVYAGYGDGGILLNDYFLAARRLVEAGVRVVTLSYGRWDWHGRPHGTNFDNARDHIPALDIGLTALIEDLDRRDMLDDTSVIVWGEFGRTPRINPKGGRDHWPKVACAMMAGGGIRTGQVIGATNRLGEHAIERPVHFQDIFATLYHNVGIDVNRATINDLSGRPRYLVDHSLYQPIKELL